MTQVKLINETTIHCCGLTHEKFLNDTHELMEKLPIVKAQIKCKDDRNPSDPSIYNIRTREEITENDIVSLYNLQKINGNVLLW